ncbi:hypothetical protein AB0H57_31170 [Micromonospora sp. NPDC050686]|uniref:hypothetical protein n=1 Tax=Micromonospora sp. NPDC050686 TaxID=3154631 RepID=UPI0033D69504
MTTTAARPLVLDCGRQDWTRALRLVQFAELDIDMAFLIAVNEQPGDDMAIALDYRTNRA